MKADGSEFPVEISISRIGLDDPPMFAAYVRDVTARKAAEESIRRLAAIVEHSNDAILATDLRGTIVAWNPAAEGLYGWTAAEIIGRHISATAPVYRQSEANFLARQVAEGKAVCRPPHRADAKGREPRRRVADPLADLRLRREAGRDGRDHPRHHGGKAHRRRAHPAAGSGEGRPAARRGAGAARLVHRRGASRPGQLAQVRRGPAASHPPDRPDVRRLVCRAYAGGRRLHQPGSGRHTQIRGRSGWPRSCRSGIRPTPTTRRACRACCAAASHSTYARSPTNCSWQAPATPSTSRSSGDSDCARP